MEQWMVQKVRFVLATCERSKGEIHQWCSTESVKVRLCMIERNFMDKEDYDSDVFMRMGELRN
ncbi:unnamed protein product, partial [Sphenostylis stenocarpa]